MGLCLCIVDHGSTRFGACGRAGARGATGFDAIGDAADTPVATVCCTRDEFNRTSRGIELLARELNMMVLEEVNP